MNMKSSILSLAVFCFALVASKHLPNRYDNFKVFRVAIVDDASANVINNDLEAYIDIWAEPRVGLHADIMVSPTDSSFVENKLKSRNMEYSVMVKNVQELMDAELVPAKGASKVSTGHPMDWTSYHSQDDMEAYMDYLVEQYPELVSTEIIGKSYEGRDMRILKICKGGTCGQKPAMWIDGGIHSREWVAHATAMWIMKELVENGGQYPSEIVNELDWYILPVLNPDGYEYSRTDNRMWRKSRSPNSGSICMGTDLNRNWAYHWNDGGSSANPCSDSYMGKSAFSEVENQNVRDFLSAHKDNIKYYVNLHSYSQLVLLPWGYTKDPMPVYDRYLEVANRANQELYATHQKIYEVGCIPCLLYPASGGTIDWVYGDAGIPYAFAMELRDTGTYGFLLPPDQIIPTGEEVMAFHVSIAQQILEEFGP